MTSADTTTADLVGTAPAAAGAADSPAGPDRTGRHGWYAVGALTGLVALTWLPRLDAAFGDDHLGRIIGRYALHLRNLQEQGLVGSHFGADWAPYASTPYAHHPPLLNLLTALTGLLPGDGEYQVWLPPYLLALLIIPAGAALLRGLGIRWTGTLLALCLTVATTFYWVYSPLMIDLGPVLALSAGIVRLRRQPDPSRRLVAATCVAALLSTLVSWPGIALAGVLGIWLVLGRRRLDRTVLLVGATMLVGVAVSLAFVVGVTGLTLLGGQAELRSSGGGFTVRQFLRRQWQYARDLLPVWYLLLLPLGGLAAMLDRRTRGYLVIAAGFTAGWVLGLSHGAFVHSYWSYPVLLVGLVGAGVLVDRLGTEFTTPVATRRAVPVVAVAGLGAYLGLLVLGPVGDRLVTGPARAGRLVAEHRPPAEQRFAWVVGSGLNSPRWLAYYWNRPARLLTVEELTAPTTRTDELVLVNLDNRPNWIPDSVGAVAVVRDGPYALVAVAALRASVVRP
ncbi:hypothetical protein [Plantactinospora sp. B5E13]|uniref:hypothetical protein n=1 Tax=Plantactinospora sp. B5E13 TaxID=3153758 RepID=UPI00325ED4F1